MPNMHNFTAENMSLNTSSIPGPSLMAVRQILTTFNLLIHVHGRAYFCTTFKLVFHLEAYFVPAPC